MMEWLSAASLYPRYSTTMHYGRRAGRNRTRDLHNSDNDAQSTPGGCSRPDGGHPFPGGYDLWLDPGFGDLAEATGMLRPVRCRADATLSRERAGEHAFIERYHFGRGI
jgi:hypothetical protein